MLGQLKKSSTLLAKIGSVLALIFLYHNIMLLHVDKKLQDSLLELRQVSNKMASNTNINGNSKFPAWNNRTKRHTLSDNDQDRYMSVDLEETSSEPVTSQCMCPPGPPGPQGPPGRRGPRGLQGVKGSRGGPVEIHYPSPNTGKTIHTRSVTTRLQDDLGLAQIVAIKALAGVGATLNPGDVLLLKGEPGSRGERGEPGQPGSPGPVGPPGKDGINGAKGDKGDRGLTTSIEGVPFPTGFVEGPAGPPGPPGLPGPQGRKGDLGERGPPGEKGDKGDRGDRGKRGKRGPKGPIGPMGKSGRKGDKGNPGAPGLDAVACPIGPDGLPVPGCAWKSQNSAIAPT